MNRNGVIERWVDWSIRHKGIVYAVVGVLTLTGIIGLYYIRKDEFPSLVIKQGLVVGIYPGATAEEVENQLTCKLEDALLSFGDIDRENLHSISCDGRCYIYTDLSCPASKKNEVYSRIKLHLQTVKQTLPPGVAAVVVLDDFNSLSSVMIALESTDKGYPELQEYADRLSTELRRIPTLAGVSVIGSQSEEIAVTVDKDLLSAYGLNSTSLMLDYQAASTALPGGGWKNQEEYSPIHVADDAASEQEIAEKIIYHDVEGNILRLSDIATIERRYASEESIVSFNGHSCLVLSVEMKQGNDIVAFGREVDAVLAAFESGLPQSIHLSRISDQPKIVSGSVSSFLRDLLLSMLVVILVMLMLFPLRSALIASSGVPICTAVTIAIMFMTGMELHTVTLAALIVVLGMIVDNSIITMDGYMNKLGQGLGKVEAATESVRELFAPTLAATLAVSAMFFPIKFIITGYLGTFVDLFPWVVLIALMVSLIYAVTVVPSLEVRFINPTSGEKGLIHRIQTVFFRWMEGGYAKAERFCFRFPALTLIIAAGAVILGLWMFSTLNVQMMPKAARDFFAVEMELEGGGTLDRTKACADSLARMLLEDPRVTNVTSFVGTGAPRFTPTYAPVLPGRNRAQLVVHTLSPKATEELIREYENNHEHLFPEAILRYKQIDYQDVDAPIMITLKGGGRDEMMAAAQEIKQYISGLDDQVKWIHSTSDDFQPVTNVILDEDEARRLGVNRMMLSLSLAGMVDGIPLGTVWEGDTGIPVKLYGSGAGEMDSPGSLEQEMVPTAIPGVNVPLRQVAAVVPSWQESSLERRAGEESITIFADMKYGKSQPVAIASIKNYVSRMNLPEGVAVQYGGLTKTNESLLPEIVLSLLCAVGILLLFMVFHFKKVSLALLTLLMSTLCFFGAFFGLWLFGLDFSLTAVLGVISLIGIIVRNGILMYEYAEQLRFEEGMSVKEAAMAAGQRRMRPIFLTSCTTALGVIPMVVGGDLLWQPMGVVICFGTLLSIILLVLVMPVAYWVFYKKADKI